MSNFDQLISSFSAAPGPLRSKENFSGPLSPATGSLSSRKAQKVGKNARTAKSKRRRQQEAMMSGANMEQLQAMFNNQRQMQNDQFSFMRDQVLNTPRMDISGRREDPSKQGFDYFFENYGPDRASVQARQERVNNSGLNQPGIWESAQQAVNQKKKQQGWIDPNTPPPSAGGMTQDQYLRQSANGVEVFNDPSFNKTNPRTGLITNTGPFTRSIEIDPRYQNGSTTARAMFPGQPVSQPLPAKQPSGPVEQLFSQNNVTQPSADIKPMLRQSPVLKDSVKQTAAQDVPAWQNMPSGPERSYLSAGVPFPGQETFLPSIFSAGGGVTNPRSGSTPYNQNDLVSYGNPRPQQASPPGGNSPYFGPSRRGVGPGQPTPMNVPYPLDRLFVNPVDPVTQEMLPSLTNMPQLPSFNMPWQHDQTIDPNNNNNYITQPNWWDKVSSTAWWNKTLQPLPSAGINPNIIPQGY